MAELTERTKMELEIITEWILQGTKLGLSRQVGKRIGELVAKGLGYEAFMSDSKEKRLNDDRD